LTSAPLLLKEINQFTSIQDNQFKKFSHSRDDVQALAVIASWSEYPIWLELSGHQ